MAQPEPLVIASDGILARSTGPWAKDKAYYVERYLSIFTRGVGQKWNGKLAYIDLFSGPGRSVVRGPDETVDGSPLIALKCNFASYVFVDHAGVLEKLRDRLKGHPKLAMISFVEGDCNEAIEEIGRRSPADHLTVAFIDPTGLQIRFKTIQRLVQNRSVDLLMTIQFGMGIKMNLPQYLQAEQAALTGFLGRTAWRKELKGSGTFSHAGKRILELYAAQLQTLGYKSVQDREIGVRTDQKNLLLYFLVLASRHPRAHDFWRKATQIQPSGQRLLDYGGD